MARAENVLIVGGGVSGMTLAIALRQKGMNVHVAEKCRREDQLGTGINLQNNALRGLEEVGVLDECLQRGFGWNTVTNRDRHGNQLHRVDLPWPTTPSRPGALGIMRTVLADILTRHAIESGAVLSFETTVAELEQRSNGVRVVLSNGHAQDFDLVVAADGVYSAIRRQVFGDEHQPRYAGQGVWRYTVPRPATIDGFTLFRTENGETVGCLPLAPDLCYYFYLESTPEKLRFEPHELPDALAARLSVFDAPELREAAGLIHEGRHISFRPFDILLMPQPWYKGRVVLLGDAAHSLTPQLTSGGGMAIEDAVVLAQELDRETDIDAALQAYCRRREQRVEAIFSNSLRICELEKGKSPDGAEGTQLMVESFKLLAAPY